MHQKDDQVRSVGGLKRGLLKHEMTFQRWSVHAEQVTSPPFVRFASLGCSTRQQLPKIEIMLSVISWWRWLSAVTVVGWLLCSSVVTGNSFHKVHHVTARVELGKEQKRHIQTHRQFCFVLETVFTKFISQSDKLGKEKTKTKKKGKKHLLAAEIQYLYWYYQFVFVFVLSICICICIINLYLYLSL